MQLKVDSVPQPQQNAVKALEDKHNNGGGGSASDNDDGGRLGQKRPPALFPTWYALVVAGFVAAVFALVVLADRRLPAPLGVQDARENPGRFLEGKARKYLKQLTSVGPRPAGMSMIQTCPTLSFVNILHIFKKYCFVGSYENEVLAVEFFRREVDAIIDKAKVAHKLSVDIQKPRGSFSLDFIDGLTHHYRDIQNFIVKLEPRDRESKHSLLLNCHFDSVPQSPGKYCY